MADFVVPDWLSDCDVDTLHNTMLGMLPANIDKTEGGFPWDFTRPTALIASEILQNYMVEALKLVFAQYSYGIYLDELAAQAQVIRKSATKATTTLTVTGIEGTVITKGMVFATAEVDASPAIEFSSDAAVTIGNSGTCQVPVTAVIAGTSGNVDAGTITLMSSPISGITSVTNEAKATGGTEEEDDDSLRERVLQAYSAVDQSYTGCDADYKRWAESVDGIGNAIVIPTWGGPGTVKIVCSDSNGEAASQSLLTAVYNYIMSPNDPLDRLAPSCVDLTVVAPTFVTVNYSFTVELEEDYTVDSVKASFKEALNSYYRSVVEAGEIKYSAVFSLISDLPGVKDYKLLTINSGTGNVEIDPDEYPLTGTVTVTSGEV